MAAGCGALSERYLSEWHSQRREIGAFTASLEDLETDRGALANSLKASEAERAALTNSLKESEAERAALTNALKSSAVERAALINFSTEIGLERDVAIATRDAILASRFWRITSPLRKLCILLHLHRSSKMRC